MNHVRTRLLCPLVATLAGSLLALAPPAQAASTTDLISRNSQGRPGNCQSSEPATSADGRLIVFTSCSGNLVPGDAGPWADVFLRNRTTGKTVRLSERPNGTQANGDSRVPAISANGRYVVFQSAANNLVPHDTNNHADVFRLDRPAGTIVRISVGPSNRQGNGDSGEGSTSISDNGRFVTFISRATNLTRSDDDNNYPDVFLRDLRENKTTLVSKTMDGAAGGGGPQGAPEISANGRYVVFGSASPDLVPGDGNGPDVFCFDRVSKTIVSLNANQTNNLGQHGAEGVTISRNGKVVAFRGIASQTGNPSPIWLAHLRFAGGVPQTPLVGDYVLVSHAAGAGADEEPGNAPKLNQSGSKVAFWSGSDALIGSDTNEKDDVFVWTGGTIRRVSVGRTGQQANDASPAFGQAEGLDINASGNTIVFTSLATNLVPNDSNNTVDVFARIQ